MTSEDTTMAPLFQSFYFQETFNSKFALKRLDCSQNENCEAENLL